MKRWWESIKITKKNLMKAWFQLVQTDSKPQDTHTLAWRAMFFSLSFLEHFESHSVFLERDFTVLLTFQISTFLNENDK